MPNQILIFAPTYNEAEGIGSFLEQIVSLKLAADVLIVDDASPDGTGEIVKAAAQKNPAIQLAQRAGKEGVGSAHLLALRYAKENGYSILISLDADFSHQPADIPRLLACSGDYDVVVGSRFLQRHSLEQWNWARKCITHLGHFLTQLLLRLPYDASGALRLYRLDRIPLTLLDSIKSRDYEFFFESLTILHVNDFKIGELMVDLPARTYGHSKMTFGLAARGLWKLLKLAFKLALSRQTLKRAKGTAMDENEMRLAWDEYWGAKDGKVAGSLYDQIASFYRNKLIRPTLNRFIKGIFAPGMELVHAGCGGGEVDVDVVSYAKVTAVDISPLAIAKYKALHGDKAEAVVLDLFRLGGLGRSFDGLYNLGVMEHFDADGIKRLLSEFCKVLKPGGRVVLFWPPVYGLSVMGLYCIHFVLNRIFRRSVQLHPPEPTKVRTRSQIAGYCRAAGLELEAMHFTLRDAFTYVVIVARKASVTV
jgi:dolichol-phosphate mannosyltransferase